MTRINCVPPKHLSNKHLIAEYREMLRLRHLHPRHSNPNVSSYRLGRGHVLFFVDKGQWLINRHNELRTEMLHRGFSCKYELDLSHWSPEFMCDWQPTVDDKLLNIARILNRS